MAVKKLTRRTLLSGAAGLAASPVLAPLAGTQPGATRNIPSTGEAIPAVGLGSWITFNVGNDPVLRAECTKVIAAFLDAGGGVIDSSPMYGSSQPVIGHALGQVGYPPTLFSADKVWTTASDGRPQIEESRRHWGVPRFDLLQVHNLVHWRAHLPLLYEMKAAGFLRYVGVTTSHGRRHEALAEIMRTEPLDFVQLTYNIADREAEARLLPLARGRGIAVIVNRPFRRGALIDRLAREPLPSWAPEIGAASWAQFLLKFILSHPAVTVAIPATTQVDHVLENKAAALGPMPDEAVRRQMVDYVREL